MRTRGEAVAAEIGHANLQIVANAYRAGWLAALEAGKRALVDGARMPSPGESMTAWLAAQDPTEPFDPTPRRGMCGECKHGGFDHEDVPGGRCTYTLAGLRPCPCPGWTRPAG